jgi:hypothetical protein
LKKKKEVDLTSPSSSSPSSSSSSSSSIPIKNITISDAKTGFIVLECVYRWPDQAVTTNLGSLILSFYQFAREVDDGGKSRYLFVSE